MVDIPAHILENASRVVLVEGVSDAAAVKAAAFVLGRDLGERRVRILQLGGVTNFRKYLLALGPRGLRIPVAGLCDGSEQHHLIRGLDAAGLGRPDDRDDLAALGFFVCWRDLEDELIRALGTDHVLDVVERNGDLPLFRTFQKQPAKREQPIDRQLHRFFGTTSGRKERYARFLCGRLQPDTVPAPLRGLIEFAAPVDQK
jgi:hypothetical protein